MPGVRVGSSFAAMRSFRFVVAKHRVTCCRLHVLDFSDKWRSSASGESGCGCHLSPNSMRCWEVRSYMRFGWQRRYSAASDTVVSGDGWPVRRRSATRTAMASTISSGKSRRRRSRFRPPKWRLGHGSATLLSLFGRVLHRRVPFRAVDHFPAPTRFEFLAFVAGVSDAQDRGNTHTRCSRLEQW